MVDEVFERLAATEGNITFSGGDPMYQAEAFTALSKRIVNELHRTIWCYTGFTFEQLQHNPRQRALLELIDVLVDGPFVKSLRDETLHFRGSRNQRLIDVPRSLEQGKAVELS